METSLYPRMTLSLIGIFAEFVVNTLRKELPYAAAQGDVGILRPEDSIIELKREARCSQVLTNRNCMQTWNLASISLSNANQFASSKYSSGGAVKDNSGVNRGFCGHTARQFQMDEIQLLFPCAR